jgi:hypothetical protein
MSAWRWLVLVSLTVLLVVWLATGSPSFQDCVSQHQKADTEEAFKKIISDLLVYRGCVGPILHTNESGITALSTFVIAVFTAILGGFTVKLAGSTRIAADAARDSVRVAEKSLEAIEAPRLDVVDTKCRIFAQDIANRMYPGSAPPPEVDTFFFNTGRSTAIIQQIYQELFFVPAMVDSPRFSVMCEGKFGITVTTPNTKTLAFPCKFHRSLTAEEIEGVRSGSTFVYLLGEIIYDDLLDWRHQYNFFLRYYPAKSGSEEFFSAESVEHNTHTKKKKS